MVDWLSNCSIASLLNLTSPFQLILSVVVLCYSPFYWPHSDLFVVSFSTRFLPWNASVESTASAFPVFRGLIHRINWRCFAFFSATEGEGNRAFCGSFIWVCLCTVKRMDKAGRGDQVKESNLSSSGWVASIAVVVTLFQWMKSDSCLVSIFQMSVQIARHRQQPSNETQYFLKKSSSVQFHFM